jgi:hypothetical protein
MSRILSLTGLGLLAACLTLLAPANSQAQSYNYGSYPGYDYGYSRSYGGGYGYGGYQYGWNNPYRYRGYGYAPRPAIVHPEYGHWTPRRGWHTHGHIHVPHRGHYHTRPY